MKKHKKKRKGVKVIPSKSQTWSVDIMLAVMIFIAGVIIFFYIVSYSGDKDVVDKLTAESEIIPERIISSDEDTANGSTFVIGNKVDNERLELVSSAPYDVLKDEMGIVSDFCIHFEDENGNLVNIGDDPLNPVYSIGNPSINFTIVDEGGNEVVVPCGS